MRPEALEWQRDFEAAITGHPSLARWLQRVEVLDECASTQDEACARAGGKSGLAVCTLLQTGGRGRLGRAWSHGGTLGLAITFVLTPSLYRASELPIRAGLAAMLACERCVGIHVASPRLALRWPNDVVERSPEPGSTRRKIAGVLIEHREGLLLLGVGVNVLHEAFDLPEQLRPTAASIRMLRGDASVTPVGCALELIRILDDVLHRPIEQVVDEWKQHDTLVGERHAFDHDAKRYSGMVMSIEPDSHIVLREPTGALVTLPANTTSLVKD
jgi:biotin-(acetyl-CoA carboxylase) ligase